MQRLGVTRQLFGVCSWRTRATRAIRNRVRLFFDKQDAMGLCKNKIADARSLACRLRAEAEARDPNGGTAKERATLKNRCGARCRGTQACR